MRYNILFFCTATQRQHGHEMRKEKNDDFPTQGHDVICGASTLGTDTFCKKLRETYLQAVIQGTLRCFPDIRMLMKICNITVAQLRTSSAIADRPRDASCHRMFHYFTEGIRTDTRELGICKSLFH